MKIVLVEPGSIADEIGLKVGDELLEVNGKKMYDAIDYRFNEDDREISIKVAREQDVTIYDIEKDEGERVGIGFEEMKILSCGNDCIFCFVDQNPEGMRKPLYFRDGDYRLSFMYGNYTTMTNAGPAILERIVAQRLSPQYISVHVTEYEVRKLLMGLKKDDFILKKIKYLHDHSIDMHTQIVLCPGINDGIVLERTVFDLYKFHKHIQSLAIVPVGLTDHRFGLFKLEKVDGGYARALLDTVEVWQKKFRRTIGRAFVYPSDEFHITAGRPIPPAKYYDGFPQTENGVGIVRWFIREFKKQARQFPKSFPEKRRLTLATAELPAEFITHDIAPVLRDIGNMELNIEVIPNTLYGRSVTVAGLLSGKCLTSALSGRSCGDLLLLPPDILNADGVFLDDMTVPKIEAHLGIPIMVFDGRWSEVFHRLGHLKDKKQRHALQLDLN